ncbi:SWI/SNF-related matrix-associated actin-dependent regulator of chromatin subfamily D member 1 [Geodia barretti]|uniref:SWI/SNF-related matrix-associated actin-dependent regulator of chromatin subfamily D member 1 n=1 Tax=Geodia barretti TaxID=519541 RepID=A0AA35T4V8_GEOBA|nr:SWI/SNF-related matrix-associated actin-dependent regulator of chromatin subfamily D member 1 [Geodia barretti]
MATRIPLGGAGSSSYIHNYQLQGRYIPAHHNVMTAHGSAGRHSLSTSHSRKVAGVQQGRVSDLAKKRMGEVSAWASKAQKMKKKRLGDKILSERVRDLVPESQAYMDLLVFERKLDATIARKRLEIQEMLRRPLKEKRKLRLFISHHFFTTEPESGEGPGIPQWELKIEGVLLEEGGAQADAKTKSKFSSFFNNVVIELDKELYGPDNHLAEWHRSSSSSSSSSSSAELDGFTVTRPGEGTVKCTILLTLNYQPIQYKLTSKLARLLGVHTATRPDIINAVWQYIKSNRLQDPQEREYINNDKYFQQIFEVPRMKFTEIPNRLQGLLSSPDPIIINHLINADAPDQKRTACYDIEVDVDSSLKSQLHSFLMSSSSQQDVNIMDNKVQYPKAGYSISK